MASILLHSVMAPWQGLLADILSIGRSLTLYSVCPDSMGS